MKITVVTDQSGKVLGTARLSTEEGQPVTQLIAGPGQHAHEIELPGNLEDIESPEALHVALEKHLASS